MEFDILEILERFQTAITGLAGFLGVIWTLRANAKHAREAHLREIETKQTTLRRIMAAEFRNYSHALRGNLEAYLPSDPSFSIGRVRRTLSESLTADLGLLDPGEIDVAVNALIRFEGLNHFLENASVAHSDTRYILPAAAWDDFCRAASTTADALDFAVEALEGTSESEAVKPENFNSARLKS